MQDMSSRTTNYLGGIILNYCHCWTMLSAILSNLRYALYKSQAGSGKKKFNVKDWTTIFSVMVVPRKFPRGFCAGGRAPV